ncbi:hypothetical protein BWD42_07545 [Sphingobacterium sp. CZ-UAM]|uniref:substrate import-associated zinc metallohydrolase lipoprotein n=1 Tax=Sphingobacterium sp. CZ-UAM TaxID=1933868 RepID=UPI0009876959|nr:substrate import-associated zinc metallohydrolase lipoprotein [Sphingobacterium sp. CZ-UAM]OOG19746.1 hypothetical protein BWD42_07545 [Sphingobacterium sp. CZ-UAM]
MKTIFKLLIGIGLISTQFSCSKEDKLNAKIENYDTFRPGEIDAWIKKNLTDPYNIEVVYRYQRNMHDINKNISPPDESKVIPQMQIIKTAFLDLYEKVGGKEFIKVYTPKQFALFGSGDYDPDGSVKGGTADGGRRITLYGLNGLNLENPNSILGNLHIVHHEFTHILNQIRMIPPEFEKVCIGDYRSDWNHPDNNPEVAGKLGFISPYARKSVGEDFAETLSNLIVAGQTVYDDQAISYGEEAKEKFKKKETIVREYMLKNFMIDLTDLQVEFQRIMETEYDSKSFSFLNAVRDSTVSDTLDLNLRAAWTEKYKVSAIQTDLFRTALANNYFVSKNEVKLKINYRDKKMTLIVPFGSVLVITGTTVEFVTTNILYDFDLIKQSVGTYKFRLSDPQGTEDDYSNGLEPRIKKDYQPLIDYLEAGTFRFDWGVLGKKTADEDAQFVTIQDISDPASGITGQVKFKK